MLYARLLVGYSTSQCLSIQFANRQEGDFELVRKELEFIKEPWYDSSDLIQYLATYIMVMINSHILRSLPSIAFFIQPSNQLSNSSSLFLRLA